MEQVGSVFLLPAVQWCNFRNQGLRGTLFSVPNLGTDIFFFRVNLLKRIRQVMEDYEIVKTNKRAKVEIFT